MYVNWDAINAVGSWVAGIGTVGAVIVALRQNKPKITVKTSIVFCTQPMLVGNRTAKDDIYEITISNTGQIPVNITGGGIKLPKTYLYIFARSDAIPKVLMPSEQTHIYTDWLDLQARGVKQKDI